MSKVVEPTYDALYVALENDKSDIPCLTVIRQIKLMGARTTEIVNTFHGDEALKLYDKLTNLKKEI